jgi:hypothetical protein
MKFGNIYIYFRLCRFGFMRPSHASKNYQLTLGVIIIQNYLPPPPRLIKKKL